MADNQQNKINKPGMRGIPKRDKHFDKVLFVDDRLDADGKRQGITKVQNETITSLEKIAKELKVSRSEVIRNALESFCRYQEDARNFGKNTFFTTKKTYDMWIQERNDIDQIFVDIQKLNQTINKNSKSPEVKFLSQQVLLLAKMINVTHKLIL